MEEMLKKNQKKWPRIFSIPIFILLAIFFCQFVSLVGNTIVSYIGGWGMILTLPLSVRYILGPAMDFTLDWYNKNFY